MAFPLLEQLIRDALGAEAEAALATPQGFPLHGSIGVDAYLRADGSVWVESYELNLNGPTDVTRVEVQGVERLTNLVIAAERRPKLRALLPARTDASRDCARCKGAGSIVFSDAERGPGLYLRVPTGQPLDQPTSFHVYCRSCGGLGLVSPMEQR